MVEPSTEAVAVSYVMPVLNERAHLAGAVASVLGQRYAGDAELILALGASTDGTTELARELAASDPRVRLIDNPLTHIPAGLNRAIAAARHPVIVRVDAHSILPEGYTERLVRALNDTGAAAVGGVMDARGRHPVQESVARAYNSPIGLGGGAYHGSRQEGEAESAYLGVFRRDALEAVGGYDETLLRAEDWELSSRLRAAGFRIWLLPSVKVGYYPRETFAQVRRQFFATGAWRGELVRRQRRTPLRYLAPPALVASMVLAPVALALRPLAPAPLRLPLGVLAAAPLAYVAVVVGAAQVMGGASWRDRVRDAAVLATMHTSWGAGFLRGFVLGARGTLDRSRVTRP